MTIQDLKEMGHDLRNTSKADVLAKIGLEARRSSGARFAFALEIFGLGLLVGAGIALLLTPKSGRELRDDIRGKLGGEPADGAMTAFRSEDGAMNS